MLYTRTVGSADRDPATVASSRCPQPPRMPGYRSPPEDQPMDPTFLPATQLAALVRGGKIGALELLDHYISRTERLDARINAVVVRDFDRARTRARMLDSQPDKSPPLFGVPTTVKESF